MGPIDFPQGWGVRLGVRGRESQRAPGGTTPGLPKGGCRPDPASPRGDRRSASPPVPGAMLLPGLGALVEGATADGSRGRGGSGNRLEVAPRLPQSTSEEGLKWRLLFRKPVFWV